MTVRTSQQVETQQIARGNNFSSLRNFMNNINDVDADIQSGDLLEYEFNIDPNATGVEFIIVQIEDKLRNNGVPKWPNMTRYAVFDQENERILIRYQEGSPFTPLVSRLILGVLTTVVLIALISWVFRKVITETGQTLEESLPQLAIGGILVAGALFLVPGLLRQEGDDTS